MNDKIKKSRQKYVQDVINKLRIYNPELIDIVSTSFDKGADLALASQWISVDEQLPEEKKAVLCYMPDMKDNYAEKDMYFDMAILLEGEFINLDAELICPSHWMSIPIPQFNTKNNDR